MTITPDPKKTTGKQAPLGKPEPAVKPIETVDSLDGQNHSNIEKFAPFCLAIRCAITRRALSVSKSN